MQRIQQRPPVLARAGRTAKVMLCRMRALARHADETGFTGLACNRTEW